VSYWLLLTFAVQVGMLQRIVQDEVIRKNKLQRLQSQEILADRRKERLKSLLVVQPTRL
jgi:hypothetical protein